MPTREKRAKALGVPIDQLPDGRGRHGNHVRGAAHYRWSAERMVSEHGYVKVRVGDDHPLADPNGYAYEHALVWVSAGRPLPGRGALLHHRNEVKTDNRLDNLELLSRAEHNRRHPKEHDSDGRFVGKRAAGRLLDGRTWEESPR